MTNTTITLYRRRMRMFPAARWTCRRRFLFFAEREREEYFLPMSMVLVSGTCSHLNLRCISRIRCDVGMSLKSNVSIFCVLFSRLRTRDNSWSIVVFFSLFSKSLSLSLSLSLSVSRSRYVMICDRKR